MRQYCNVVFTPTPMSLFGSRMSVLRELDCSLKIGNSQRLGQHLGYEERFICIFLYKCIFVLKRSFKSNRCLTVSRT